MKNFLPAIKNKPIIEKISLSLSEDELIRSFGNIPGASILNSSLPSDSGRFTYIGLYPIMSVNSTSNNVCISIDGHKIMINKDPYDCLSLIFKKYNVINPTPLPFVAGGIGYFSYDMKDITENLPKRSVDDLNLPEMLFLFYNTILIFDKTSPESLYISVLEHDINCNGNASDMILRIKKNLENIQPKSSFSDVNNEKSGSLLSDISNAPSTLAKDQYIQAVKKILDYIAAGDIYQACLSRRFSANCHEDPFLIYQKLNKVNPAPFSAFINYGGFSILSSSPELFLRVRGNQIETRPMKGTRPRGNSETEDQILMKDLIESRKDNAELSMIVDLERNDLGKVCVPGSIYVSEHRRIETYPTVFQTISVVKGILQDNTDRIDAVKALFPGGSITGCPKIRAMEIIDELEPVKRGVYTGSIGFISFHDTMDLNIAIRTMIAKDGKIHFQAGGGIVTDSNPEDEYEETLHKAKALFDTLYASSVNDIVRK